MQLTAIINLVTTFYIVHYYTLQNTGYVVAVDEWK